MRASIRHGFRRTKIRSMFHQICYVLGILRSKETCACGHNQQVADLVLCSCVTCSSCGAWVVVQGKLTALSKYTFRALHWLKACGVAVSVKCPHKVDRHVSPPHDLPLFPRSQSAAPADSRNAMLTLPVCRDGGIVRPDPRHWLRPRT
jgi:hypothetical protein